MCGRREEGVAEGAALKGELKGVISDIEWGVLSGLFDFTIINTDQDQSITELRRALTYV